MNAIYIDNRAKLVFITQETVWDLETGKDGQRKSRPTGDPIPKQTSL